MSERVKDGRNGRQGWKQQGRVMVANSLFFRAAFIFAAMKFNYLLGIGTPKFFHWISNIKLGKTTVEVGTNANTFSDHLLTFPLAQGPPTVCLIFLPSPLISFKYQIIGDHNLHFGCCWLSWLQGRRGCWGSWKRQGMEGEMRGGAGGKNERRSGQLRKANIWSLIQISLNNLNIDGGNNRWFNIGPVQLGERHQSISKKPVRKQKKQLMSGFYQPIQLFAQTSVFIFPYAFNSIQISKQMSHDMKKSSFKQIASVLLDQTKFIATGESPIDELGLQHRGGEDLLQLKKILGEVLSYPSSHLADLHRDANRLGDLDRKRNGGDEETSIENFEQLGENAQFCPCCGFIKQEDPVKILTSVKDLNNIGVSTFLYFETLFHLIVMLVLAFLIYGIYSLITNIQAANAYRQSITENLKDYKISYEGFLVLSLGSKQLHNRPTDKLYYQIQCWIGVGLVMVWGLYFIFIKLREKKGVAELLQDTKSAADFSIVIENFPIDMTLTTLQDDLNKYQREMAENHNYYQTDNVSLEIAKLNVGQPFYLNSEQFKSESLKQVSKEYAEYIDKFITWIEYRQQHDQFELPKAERQQIYEEFEAIKLKRQEIITKIANRIKRQIESKDQDTTVAFVTFRSNKAKQYMLDFNEEDASDRIRRFLTCCFGGRKLILRKSDGEENVAYIQQAPEPEDIRWTNLGQPSWELAKRKLLTFLVTIIVLGISFGAVFGLSKVQTVYASKQTSSKSANQYISFLISLVISIFNVIIMQVLRRLTYMERDYTDTNYQASLAIKAVWALLINSILIPILVNHIFKQNIYGVNGLAYDVFLLGITNSFLPPFMKIFDGYYFFTRMIECYSNRPNSKLSLNQAELNTNTEYIEFEVGYEYISTVNLFLFTCFFCSLQPIIILFAITGMLIMFWAQKYSLFYRCRRPTPGSKLVNTTMYTMIYLGPLFYSIGSFCWSNFFTAKFIGIAPNLTATIISAVIFIMPYRFIIHKCASQDTEEPMIYEKTRIYFPSEYDRLNPTTSKEAVEEYLQFINNFKNELQKKGSGEVEEVEKMLVRQLGRGHRGQNLDIAHALGLGSTRKNANLFGDLLGVQNVTTSPYLIGNTIIPGQHAINFAVQNWATDEEKRQNPNNSAAGNPFLQLAQQAKTNNTGSPLELLREDVHNSANSGWSKPQAPVGNEIERQLFENAYHNGGAFNPFAAVGGMQNPLAQLFYANFNAGGVSDHQGPRSETEEYLNPFRNPNA